MLYFSAFFERSREKRILRYNSPFLNRYNKTINIKSQIIERMDSSSKYAKFVGLQKQTKWLRAKEMHQAECAYFL
jgi:folylpolyglutamate synthase/dihydropteroate synthase